MVLLQRRVFFVLDLVLSFAVCVNSTNLLSCWYEWNKSWNPLLHVDMEARVAQPNVTNGSVSIEQLRRISWLFFVVVICFAQFGGDERHLMAPWLIPLSIFRDELHLYLSWCMSIMCCRQQPMDYLFRAAKVFFLFLDRRRIRFCVDAKQQQRKYIISFATLVGCEQVVMVVGKRQYSRTKQETKEIKNETLIFGMLFGSWFFHIFHSMKSFVKRTSTHTPE